MGHREARRGRTLVVTVEPTGKCGRAAGLVLVTAKASLFRTAEPEQRILRRRSSRQWAVFPDRFWSQFASKIQTTLSCIFPSSPIGIIPTARIDLRRVPTILVAAIPTACNVTTQEFRALNRDMANEAGLVASAFGGVAQIASGVATLSGLVGNQCGRCGRGVRNGCSGVCSGCCNY